MQTKFKTKLLVASVLLASAAAAQPALAQDALSETRTAIGQIMARCPAGDGQRACIYKLQKIDTELYDIAHPPSDAKQVAFRACTTPKALDLQTDFIVDLLKLKENQWPQRMDTLQRDAQANWTACTPKN